jgi:hypothetical protein
VSALAYIMHESATGKFYTYIYDMVYIWWWCARVCSTYSPNHETKLVLLRNKEEKKFSIKLKITKEQNKGNDKYNKYIKRMMRVRIRARTNFIFLKADIKHAHTQFSVLFGIRKMCMRENVHSHLCVVRKIVS